MISCRNEMTGVDTPAHLDRVADFEELGAACTGNGEHRLELATFRRTDDVYRDVAEIQKIGDGTVEMIGVRGVGSGIGRALRRRSSGANPLRSQRDRAAAARGARHADRRSNRPQALDVDRYRAIAAGSDGSFEQVARADE